MRYFLKTTHCAALVELRDEQSNVYEFVYYSGDKFPEPVPSTEAKYGADVFNRLPVEVRAAINKHFGTVFSLPIGARGYYVDHCEVETIDVDRIIGTLSASYRVMS